MPLEKSPGAVPRIALIGGVDPFERLRVHPPAEGMADTASPWRGVDVDLRFGEVGFGRHNAPIFTAASAAHRSYPKAARNDEW